MKAVLISIKPKYCALIASGNKTIEVRKTRPKLDEPFKCYIYCTQNELLTRSHHTGKMYVVSKKKYRGALERNGNVTYSGTVIGEFVCDSIEYFDSAFDEWARLVAPGGSIIDSMGWDKFLEVVEKKARITMAELEKYFPEDVKAYLWHISDLKIYDTPKELGDFTPCCRYIVDDGECDFLRIKCHKQRFDYNPDGIVNVCGCGNKMSKAPQSWCYVYD